MRDDVVTTQNALSYEIIIIRKGENFISSLYIYACNNHDDDFRCSLSFLRVSLNNNYLNMCMYGVCVVGSFFSLSC